MANNYTKSKKTDQDINHITKRSLADFGELQTNGYMGGLEESLELLANNPQLGGQVKHPSLSENKYCFHKYVSHVIYYRQRRHDIFIVRILHKKMLPEKHL